MNKLLTTVAAFSVAMMSLAGTANSMEFKVGVGGVSSAYYANVQEKLKDSGRKSNTEAAAAFSYMNGFAEVAFDEAMGITVGLEYSPESIKLNKATRIIHGSDGSAGARTGEDANLGEQVIEAAFKDLLNVYVAMPIMGSGLHVKAGYTTTKITTKETLATGSTYGNKTVSGGTIGLYFDGELGSNVFYRLEGAYQTFDDIKLTGSEAGGTAGSFNTITAELGGVAAKASLGFKF